jgi:4a-hydroxytetrahydrobiopterin dehydratase
MDEMTCSLRQKKCHPCEGGMPPLADDDVQHLLPGVPGWKLEEKEIVRTFSFKNYYQTVAFVNAVAWIAHREDHHPDISFGYKTCTIRYSTHAVGGLSENDFICAAKIDALSG